MLGRHAQVHAKSISDHAVKIAYSWDAITFS